MRVEHDNETIADDVAAVLAAPSVRPAIERLLAHGERERIAHAVESMRRKTAFVAAVGSQGSGKSSLLNSLLFPVRTLPVGEGVTTNIVCFVRKAEDKNGNRAEVRLKSGATSTIPLSRRSLEKYMDESQNPSNEIGVASVTCFTQNALLTNGTAFVDTPGLGSLEEWQDSVTMGFVREISLAICVIRTTPTLRESEAEFLRDIWPLCPEIIFVQNVWQESEAQIREAMLVNTEHLTKIARERGDARPVLLFRVNIHEGLEGVTNDQPERVSSSGLGAFQTVLSERVARGGRRLEIMLQGRQVIQCLQAGIRQGESESIVAATTNAGAVELLKGKIEDAEERLRSITSDQRKRSSKFRALCTDIVHSSNRYLTDRVNQVRDEFTRSKDDAYIKSEYAVRLKRAANDGFSDFTGRLAGTCDLYIAESAQSIDNMARSLDLTSEDIPTDADVSAGTQFGEIAGKLTTWSSTITLTALTSISAMAFGAAIAAGSTITAAIAAGGAAVPVVGWVVSATALVVGIAMKAAAKEKKRTAMREAINSTAQQTIDSATKSISHEGDEIRDKILGGVQEAFNATADQQEKLLNDLKDTLNLSTKGREVLLAELKLMIVSLTGAIRNIGDITQF